MIEIRREPTMIKTAIVTGASGSIGGAIALKLSKADYCLVLTGHTAKQKLEQTAHLCQKNHSKKETAVHTLYGDLSDPSTADRLIKEGLSYLEHIDLLVNCAGISHIGLLGDMTDAEWDRIMNTNLSSAFYCCRSVIPSMVHQKFGHILNISSVWGVSGASCEVAYSAAKGGLNSFTKALAKELAPSRIAVNALACGMIDTPMNHCFSEEEIQAICEEIPAGRMGTTEEVADLVLHLAESPVYLTGQIITMDGGWI